MSKESEFGNHKRRVDSQWEKIHPDSPLAKDYESVLWAQATQFSDRFECNDQPCDKKSWIVIHSNPVKLRDLNGELIDINDLESQQQVLVRATRNQVVALCQSHFMQRYANKLGSNQR